MKYKGLDTSSLIHHGNLQSNGYTNNVINDCVKIQFNVIPII